MPCPAIAIQIASATSWARAFSLDLYPSIPVGLPARANAAAASRRMRSMAASFGRTKAANSSGAAATPPQ